jgi:hypothetical protein
MKLQHALAAALLLSACTTTEYVYTPPATPEGKACVERCQASQASCRRDQDARAERIRLQCQAEADRREAACRIQAPIEYAACLKFAKNDEERAACQLQDCAQAACQAVSSYALCDNDFRFCYQNCGGTIDLIER